MDPLSAIRKAIEEGRYQFSLHALEEADNDALAAIDIESAVLTGRLVRTDDDPLRGPKHVLEGLASDLHARVGVVTRLRADGSAVIITVYEVRE